MKRVAKIFLILFTISTVFTSCRETKGEKVEDAVEDVVDDVGDAVDDVSDDIEDAVD